MNGPFRPSPLFPNPVIRQGIKNNFNDTKQSFPRILIQPNQVKFLLSNERSTWQFLIHYSVQRIEKSLLRHVYHVLATSEGVLRWASSEIWPQKGLDFPVISSINSQFCECQQERKESWNDHHLRWLNPSNYHSFCRSGQHEISDFTYCNQLQHFDGLEDPTFSLGHRQEWIGSLCLHLTLWRNFDMLPDNQEHWENRRSDWTQRPPQPQPHLLASEEAEMLFCSILFMSLFINSNNKIALLRKNKNAFSDIRNIFCLKKLISSERFFFERKKNLSKLNFLTEHFYSGRIEAR